MSGGKPIGPREAHRLAYGVRSLVERPDWRHAPQAGPYRELPRRQGLRPSAMRVLELLLRHVDEHHVVSRRTAWIAQELALGQSTVARARRELELAGLVHVARRGLGHVVTVYRVAVERIRELVDALPGSTQTTPGEHSPPLPGSAQTPLGEYTQRGGARDARVLPHTQRPPTPEGGHTGEPVVDEGHPPVSDGAPPVSEPCEHGRTTRQGGCRTCGTTVRQQKAAAAQRAQRVAAEKRRDEQAQRRRAEEDARGDVPLAAAGIASLRAAIGRPPRELVNGARR